MEEEEKGKGKQKGKQKEKMKTAESACTSLGVCQITNEEMPDKKAGWGKRDPALAFFVLCWEWEWEWPM